MHLQFPLTLFSVGLMVSVASPYPLVEPTRNGSTVTFPLKHVEAPNDDHPLVRYQRQIDRARVRFAFITGHKHSTPTHQELRGTLIERTISIHRDELVGQNTSVVKRQDSGHGGPQTEADIMSGDIVLGTGDVIYQSAHIDTTARDVVYLLTAHLGTPPLPYSLILDTGSSYTWVAGANCTSCQNRQVLSLQTSSTFKDTGRTFTVQYGGGVTIPGSFIRDNFDIAGVKFYDHTFGVVSQLSGLANTPADGLLGLGNSEGTQEKILTFVEAAAIVNLIIDPTTCFRLPRSSGDHDSEVTFGGSDLNQWVFGTLAVMQNITPYGFWKVSIDSISVDDKDIGVKRIAIVDTGTTLIGAPPEDVDAIHNRIPGAKADGKGGYTVPCGTMVSVVFRFGGQDFAMNPKDLALGSATADPNWDCPSAIFSQSGSTEYLLGGAFLKNVYGCLDARNQEVTFAKLK